MVKFSWMNSSFCRLIADEGVIMELYEKYSYRPLNYNFTPKFKSGRWDGWIRLVRKNGIFPTGMVPIVSKYLIDSGYQISFSPEFRVFKETFHFDEEELELSEDLWENQTLAIDTVLKKKRRTILSPTSSGKSMILYCLSRVFEREGLKTLIIVPSIMLLNQIVEDFRDYSSLNEWDVDGAVHKVTDKTGKTSDKSIIISTWQSLQYIEEEEYFTQFDAVMCDEVHGAKATEISRIMELCVNGFYRVGLTGTLDGVTANEMVVQSHFGPVTRVASTKQMQDEGKIAKVKIEGHILKYTDPAFLKAVKGMPYKSEIDVLVNKKSRNQYIADLAGNLDGNTLILCVLVDKHIKPLAKMIAEKFPNKQVHIIVGGMKGEERERLRKLAETRDDMIIVSNYALMSTGVSINNLHNCIFAHPMKASIKILQSIGRVLRKHPSKEFAMVYDISDDMRSCKRENYSLKHFVVRMGLYTSEKFPTITKEVRL